ncbi:flagellar basal body P-ring formation chaperone FlgA [Sneathiella marina]|uniref:Flagellar basal body P-ring formation chaperone FlgA n=1 Tax=Sneathiella marina TaxID=2950108 RepID=A0ABY4VYX9_9PROT|nr:flagellar basal body P-ring formation chaperone FlgA [Sneathiella marina]USG59836.1 flagellar basal body P-ring formation chaperone FlgA [Sneathiella marina]
MKYFITTITLIFALIAPIAAQGADITLRPQITVEGDTITFGDLFDGTGEKADQTVAPAPAPGKSKVFKAKSVANFVRSHGFTWRPATPVRRIKVRRLGITIPHENISDEIRNAIEYELGAELFEMALSSQHTNIKVGTEQDPSVSVENLYFNKRSGQFTAELLAPAHDQNGYRFKLGGKVHKQVMIPVLKRFTPSGREILEDDIEFKAERSSKVGRNVVTDAALLIGKSPRRSIRSGMAVSLNNLGDPVTVEKGKLVAVILQSGGMFLSISGRTMEAGGTGDVIRVENINSRKIIQAEVVTSQKVRIISNPDQLASLR